jgi:hypothetical protein
MSKFGQTDWLLGDIVNTTPLTGGKDAFIQSVKVTDSAGVISAQRSVDRTTRPSPRARQRKPLARPEGLATISPVCW